MGERSHENINIRTYFFLSVPLIVSGTHFFYDPNNQIAEVAFYTALSILSIKAMSDFIPSIRNSNNAARHNPGR